MLEVDFARRAVSFCKKWGKDKLTQRSENDDPEMLLELRTLKNIWKDMKEKAHLLRIPIDKEMDKLFGIN